MKHWQLHHPFGLTLSLRLHPPCLALCYRLNAWPHLGRQIDSHKKQHRRRDQRHWIAPSCQPVHCIHTFSESVHKQANLTETVIVTEVYCAQKQIGNSTASKQANKPYWNCNRNRSMLYSQVDRQKHLQSRSTGSWQGSLSQVKCILSFLSGEALISNSGLSFAAAAIL